ncbi:hypothetical protein MY11210_006526 [Beauveria gryllotalpidicola]
MATSDFHRTLKRDAKKAYKAYMNGGWFVGNGKPEHFSKFLPTKAELLALRYANPFGNTEPSIAAAMSAINRSDLCDLLPNANSLSTATIIPRSSDNTDALAIAQSALAKVKELEAVMVDMNAWAERVNAKLESAPAQNNGQNDKNEAGLSDVNNKVAECILTTNKITSSHSALTKEIATIRVKTFKAEVLSENATSKVISFENDLKINSTQMRKDIDKLQDDVTKLQVNSIVRRPVSMKQLPLLLAPKPPSTPKPLGASGAISLDASTVLTTPAATQAIPTASASVSTTVASPAATQAIPTMTTAEKATAATPNPSSGQPIPTTGAAEVVNKGETAQTPNKVGLTPINSSKEKASPAAGETIAPADAAATDEAGDSVVPAAANAAKAPARRGRKRAPATPASAGSPNPSKKSCSARPAASSDASRARSVLATDKGQDRRASRWR